MSGFCGWIAAGPTRQPAEDSLAQMGAELPPLQQSQFLEAGDNYGVFARPTDIGHVLVSETGTLATIDGDIQWHDPELNYIAAEKGDAAALICAYQVDGRNLLTGISGEFALAVIEPAKQELLLAIDRFGTKPMAYASSSDSGLVFGSTVEAIRQCSTIDAEIDQQALFNYFYFHEVPSPGTVYKNISKLQPGEYLFYSQGRVSVDSYWNPVFTDSPFESSTNLQAELRETLAQAVLTKLGNTRSSACFLSGGLDSSAIAGMVAECQTGKTVAYTMGFEAAGYDEMQYARLAAKHFGIDLREYYVTQQDIVDAMPIIAAGYDEPFGNSSAVPTLMCARRAREDGIETMLAGDGGDELFGGNERYSKQEIFELYHRIPRKLRADILEPLAAILPELFPFGKAKSYVAQARFEMPGRLETYNFLNREPLETIFEGDFLAQVAASLPLQMQTERYSSANSQSLVNKMLWLDWKFTLADNDLRKVARSCELANVRVTYPMLDQKLVDLSLRIPSSQKVHGKQLRYLYKQALQDFLPPEIIDKPKHGFGLPFGVWLTNSRLIQDFLYPEIDDLGKRGIFQTSFLTQIIKANRNEHAAYYGNQIYVLSMLELWLKAHH